MGNLAATTSYSCLGSQGQLRLDSITPPAGAAAPVTYSWQVGNTLTGTQYGGPVDLAQLPLTVDVADGPYIVLVLAEDAAQQQYATDGTPYEVDCSGGTGGGGGGTIGCTDEYADNYDPEATSDTTPSSCTYTPRWRSAWGPAGVAVRVAAVAGQVAGYIEAALRVGFRPGHPLAADRPLGDPLTLRATVGPDGYATFVLGPYLRPQLGAPDGAGGRRLDLNSLTAYTSDLFVGYELRRAGTGQLLEHGYVLNAAVPDAALASFLTPFTMLPVWPGFSDYLVSTRYATLAGFGMLATEQPNGIGDIVTLPCPPNPLLVAWLAPGGGYGYWVFQGKPALADVVSDGQRYREALTGESRWSERGEARRTYTASSGPYRGVALAEGLATLGRSPQVWVKPDASSAVWVPVTIDAGTFPVRQWGVQRNEISITFTEAAAWYAQGQ